MPEIKYTGNARAAERAAKEMERALKELEKQGDETTESLEQLNKKAVKLSEQADPMKRYNRQMKELAVLVDRQVISKTEAVKIAQRYGEQLDKIQSKGKQAWGSDMLRRVAAMGSAMSVMYGTMRLLTKEWQAQREHADAMGSRVTSLAGAEGAFIFNTATADSQTRAALRQQVQDLGGLGVSTRAAFQAVGETYSATGSNLQRTIDATTFAARVTGNEEQLLALAPGLADVMGATGMGAEQALGALQGFQANTRIGTIMGSARGAGRAAMRGRQLGGTGMGGMAILAGLTAGGVDPRGELSTTATTNVLNRLMDFNATHNLGARSPMEALQAVMMSGRGREFMGSYAWGNETLGGIEAIFTGGLGYQRAMQTYYGIDTAAERRAFAQAPIQQFAGSEIQASRRAEVSSSAAIDQMATARARGEGGVVVSGEMRANLDMALMELYGSRTEADIAMTALGPSVTAPELRGALNTALRHARPVIPTPYSDRVIQAELTPEQQDAQGSIERLIATVDRLTNEMERANAGQESRATAGAAE